MSFEGAAESWLEAATAGGLPEPTRHRWQPLRVGIVNLWEYDDAQFWFADGRLVLRGGNGAGKTKILELTTLMLLRGEISPSVLDPFGSQHRTMRFNLLPTGEGDDPRAPADSGLGYAWVEFGRLAEVGAPQYFVCGMGASARRGSGTGGVSTWHLITARRPGAELALVVDGQPLELKELRKLDGVTVPGSAGAYRARIADELFGMSLDSYDNLTELLKQLRKPKLGERLNPASLAQTLRDALPPLAAQEVGQLAEGWDHLEQLRRAVEQTEEAARAVAQFVRSGWRPWARVLLRRRAEALTSATTTLDKTTRDKREADEALAGVRQQLSGVETRLQESRATTDDREVELRELLESRAYQDAVAATQRVEELRRALAGLTRQRDAAQLREQREQGLVREARARAGAAQAAAGQAADRVGQTAQAVAELAAGAGLQEATERHLPAHDVDALAAAHAGRVERFSRLRELHDDHARVHQQAERSAQAVEAIQQSLTAARQDESGSGREVADRAEALRARISDWAATGAFPVEAGIVADWLDLVAELTVIDLSAGTARPGPSPAEAMRARLSSVRQVVAERAEAARLDRAPLAQRHRVASGELERVRAAAEASPPDPTGWRRRDRPGPQDGAGAPLWRLVNPRESVSGDRLDRLEAALAASGLLDAWISPDGALLMAGATPVTDLQLPLGDRRPADNLLAVLSPDQGGGVGVQTVERVLAGLGWWPQARPEQPGDWLAADGSWRVGGLVGQAEPAQPASYLGAAARQAARERELARLEAELAVLAARIGELDGELARLAAQLDRLAGQERAIPAAAERELGAAVATLAERARRRAGLELDLDREQLRHNENVTRRDTAWAVFADYAGLHRFGLRDLDRQAQALQAFESRLNRLVGDLELLAVAEQAAGAAQETVLEREASGQAAADEVARLGEEHRQGAVRLSTAESALGTDHRAHLERRAGLDAELGELRGLVEALREELAGLREGAAVAAQVLAGHEERRAQAETARDLAQQALWSVVDAGLAEPLGLAVPERRTVQASKDLALAARREITVPADAPDEERAWRRCIQQLDELRQHLLPNRDARIDDDEERDVPQVTVLADPAAGWQPPHLAADALAQRVREQQDSFDAEQQRVLTTLLGSTFIEHLKDRLDYTTRTFAHINARLARHPTRQGHLVRVQCEADPTDPDAGAVVSALGRGFDELTQDRQDTVRGFLARKIDEARGEAAAAGATDWKDELARALDYRGWLRLSLQYRPGAGAPWAVFDAARHGAKSGGEKVVLLSQPLFAAAVVAYDAAGPQAPRWVWLDEAMTGVDAAIKASFMGLTVDFELDVMLTAHDEWCTYPTVPAVAVYDLARQEHLPGVDALPYLWCGGELTALQVDRLGVVTSMPEPADDDLFAQLGDAG